MSVACSIVQFLLVMLQQVWFALQTGMNVDETVAFVSDLRVTFSNDIHRISCDFANIAEEGMNILSVENVRHTNEPI